MPIRNGSQYISGLRDGREVWYGGEKVADVTKFPQFEAAVREAKGKRQLAMPLC